MICRPLDCTSAHFSQSLPLYGVDLQPIEYGIQALFPKKWPEIGVPPVGAVPLEPPIESLDTVEHPFPDEVTESEAPHEEAAAPEEDDVPQPEPAPAEGAEEGEDVLADTPEFLKDQPEDDELWFEQGEPKDFDF